MSHPLESLPRPPSQQESLFACYHTSSWILCATTLTIWYFHLYFLKIVSLPIREQAVGNRDDKTFPVYMLILFPYKKILILLRYPVLCYAALGLRRGWPLYSPTLGNGMTDQWESLIPGQWLAQNWVFRASLAKKTWDRAFRGFWESCSLSRKGHGKPQPFFSLWSWMKKHFSKSHLWEE